METPIQVPLPFWFCKKPGLALPFACLPKPEYYEVIMAKLNVDSKEKIKQLAMQNRINFTEFCLYVYDSVPEFKEPKITITFNNHKPLKDITKNNH